MENDIIELQTSINKMEDIIQRFFNNSNIQYIIIIHKEYYFI